MRLPDDARLLPARLMRAGALLAALVLVGCMPPRATGGRLSPTSDRVTNAVVRGDRATLAAWNDRLRGAMARDVALPSDSLHLRRRAAARAAAWLAFARESYDADPRGALADSALGEGARLVAILEREMSDSVAASLRAADGAPLVAGALRVRDDLWSLAEALRGTGEDERAAEAEVLLVRAGLVARTTGEAPPGAPTCGPWSPLARAERLLHEATPVMAMSPRPPRPVALMVPVMDSLVVDTLRVEEPGVAFGRGVHFALDSDSLSPASRRLLDGVVAALAARGDVDLVLEGHTDPRGRPSYNDSLSRRRADAVHAYLSAAGLQPRRIEVRALGKNQRATLGSTFMDYAVDRRVMLRFYEADGRELTADDLRDDLQLEVVRTRVRRIRLSRPR